MHRRTFLAAAPLLLTTAKGQPATPRMGAGAFHYEALHDFLQPPPTLKFGNTHGIVVTADGRIVLCHTVHKTSESPDAIAIFDADGQFIKSWGADLRGGAHGLVIRREGGQEFLYHCDNVKGFVRKTTLDGEVVWILHAPLESGLYAKASEYRPSTLAFAPNGDFYVADGYGKFYITTTPAAATSKVSAAHVPKWTASKARKPPPAPPSGPTPSPSTRVELSPYSWSANAAITAAYSTSRSKESRCTC